MLLRVELGESGERQRTLWVTLLTLLKASLSNSLLHPLERDLGVGLGPNLLVGPFREAPCANNL